MPFYVIRGVEQLDEARQGPRGVPQQAFVMAEGFGHETREAAERAAEASLDARPYRIVEAVSGPVAVLEASGANPPAEIMEKIRERGDRPPAELIADLMRRADGGDEEARSALDAFRRRGLLDDEEPGGAPREPEP